MIRRALPATGGMAAATGGMLALIRQPALLYIVASATLITLAALACTAAFSRSDWRRKSAIAVLKLVFDFLRPHR